MISVTFFESSVVTRLILISEVSLGVGKVKGWTPLRMQGSDYRFNFSVSRRRLRVCDIIHSDKVSHLHRFSAVTVIHRGRRRERVSALSYQWTAEGNRKLCYKAPYLMTSWPLMKRITWINLENSFAVWEINDMLLQLNCQEKLMRSVCKSQAFPAYAIWWIDGSGLSRLFLPPSRIQLFWQESNYFPRQKT